MNYNGALYNVKICCVIVYYFYAQKLNDDLCA
jgi:hypothetical protein